VTKNIQVGDRIVRISYLNGRPWYAEVFVKLPRNMKVTRASMRTIWHRANQKPLAGLAKQAFDADGAK
jgi:hypothetical protein